MDISAENTWTDPVTANGSDTSVEVWDRASFVGSFSIQFRPVGESEWRTQARYDESKIAEEGGDTVVILAATPGRPVQYRAGVATGDYTSGTAGIVVS